MNGVRILHTIENPVYGFGLSWRFVIPLAITALLIISTVLMLKYNKKHFNIYLDNDSFLLLMFSILGLVVSILMLFNGKVIDTYPTYEVCTDETVNMVEFLNKYEIIEQREDLLVVQERG